MNVRFHEPPPAQKATGCCVACGESTELPTGADLLHFHGIWQPAHARLAREARARGVPFVVSPHGMLEPWAWRHKWWKKWPYFLLVERRYLRSASALLATAPAEAARLASMFPGRRIETLPRGMTGAAGPDYAAARHQLGWAEHERVLLFLSRIHVKKGLDLLLRALAETPGAREQTRLVIVGGGEASYLRQLRALAANLPLPRTDWIGEVWGDDRWKYFQGADLFCLPSHSENFGLAVLEALQVGTPVLTTRATPWAEDLIDGRGYPCDATVESVRAALERSFQDPPRSSEDRERLAEWARAKFAWSALAPRYLALYRELRASSHA